MDIIGTCTNCVPALSSFAVTLFFGIAGLVLGLLGQSRKAFRAVH
jgi:hypothetical protein